MEKEIELEDLVHFARETETILKGILETYRKSLAEFHQVVPCASWPDVLAAALRQEKLSIRARFFWKPSPRLLVERLVWRIRKTKKGYEEMRKRLLEEGVYMRPWDEIIEMETNYKSYPISERSYRKAN